MVIAQLLYTVDGKEEAVEADHVAVGRPNTDELGLDVPPVLK